MGERLNYYIKSETEKHDYDTVVREFDIREFPLENFHKETFIRKGFEEVEKSTFEKKICDGLVVAAEDVVRRLSLGNIGKRIGVTSNSIHVLTPSEMKDSQNDHRPALAYNYHGNAYVPQIDKDTSKEDFVLMTAHELAHGLSAHATAIKHHEGELRSVNFAAGLSFQNEEGEWLFYGMMEAVNELFAWQIRKSFLQKTEDFRGKKEQQALDQPVAYPGAVIVVRELLKDNGIAGEDEKGALSQLLRDHVTGHHVFLDTLGKYRPKVYDVLKKMGTETKDALQAAKQLKFRQASHDIKNFIRPTFDI